MNNKVYKLYNTDDNEVVWFTMNEILHLINDGKPSDWVSYNESNWKDGLNEWTNWKSVDTDNETTRFEPTYPVKYRGCYKDDGDSNPNDPMVGRIEYWTMSHILYEINHDRSEDWTPYDESDWEEGLNEWTEWEPVK